MSASIFFGGYTTARKISVRMNGGGSCCRSGISQTMARRKGEIIASMNQRDYPHIVQLPLPLGGFRSQSDDMLAFHRERGIEPRRGRGWHDDDRYYVRYCFADPAHADAFRDRFGGERLSAASGRSGREKRS
jgi:hypothetical protein